MDKFDWKRSKMDQLIQISKSSFNQNSISKPDFRIIVIHCLNSDVQIRIVRTIWYRTPNRTLFLALFLIWHFRFSALAQPDYCTEFPDCTILVCKLGGTRVFVLNRFSVFCCSKQIKTTQKEVKRNQTNWIE